jgi:uncharacterized protein (TIGR02757 family)
LIDSEIALRLREYVDEIMNQGIVDLSFRKDQKLEIPIDPSNIRTEQEKRLATHWLLLNAAIDQSRLVGPAENARALLSKLYGKIGKDLLTVIDEDLLTLHIQQLQISIRNINLVSMILCDVNKFVADLPNGDLYRWGKMFSSPIEIVEQLATNIYYQGRELSSSARKKPWMYVRWMVRPKPDLRIWDHLNTSDLFVPLDGNVAKVAVKFNILSKNKLQQGATLGWSDVQRVTDFARHLFPDDPAKVDYPFFLLGTSTSEGREAKQIFNQIMASTSIRWDQ